MTQSPMKISRTDTHTLLERELPPVAESVAYARDLAVHSVAPALRHDVALVVAELVANAVRRGSGPVGLRVEMEGETVRISVRDAGVTTFEGHDHGTGFHVVDQLATATGIDHDETGKTVWATLDGRRAADGLIALRRN
jgi:hypothetical protein